MKTRQRQPSRCRTAADWRMHPVGLAALLALSGTAWALPQGATVVNGQVTIGRPNPTTQVITQGTQRAIIDWNSFSIGGGERVRFNQPSSSAVVLNRVTGSDPSNILGQLQGNGRIFLLNPQGVVFGSAARVDAAGLVASSLSLSNADFLAGRLNLGSDGSPARGEVRNEGVISAPGGLVVLAGPSVTNSGTISAPGGRVGMAAAQQVLVDVEGDGLVFFQASATEAGNRLAQLGRIQADGGSVELRAVARGAFADTVLNLSGVVQARSLGTKEGRIVIDGGDAGITRVAGTLDASAPADDGRGGRVTVTGQKVWLDDGARLDASGGAGGGRVLVGGNWQGQGPERNAEQTHVGAGASIDVSARAAGDGGTAVVWADGTTRFYGGIAARGGATGGDGGQVEVSGKEHLAFAGQVSTSAPHGRTGSLLLDPSNIVISASGTDEVDVNGGPPPPGDPFDVEGTDATSTLTVATLVGLLGTSSVVVDANAGSAGGAGSGSIAVNSAVSWGTANSLTLRAATTITSSASGTITSTSTDAGGGGSLFLQAAGAVTLNAPVTLSGGDFRVTGMTGGTTSAASFNSSGVTITTTGAAGQGGGDVTIRTSGSLTAGPIVARGGNGAAGATAANGTAGLDGGAVLLRTTNGSITTVGINTTGGTGGKGGQDGGGGTPAGGGGVGGKGGTITLDSASATGGRDVTVSGTLTAVGGTGGADGDGSLVAGAGTGGAGGAVAITSSAGAVSVAAINSHGGDGGANLVGTGATGAGANITLTAGTDLTPTGALNAGTGSTLTLSFNDDNGGGTLDLTGVGTLTAGTINADGGTGTETLLFSSDAASITLANAQLQADTLTINLAAINDAVLSGGAGGNTIVASGWTGGRTLTVNLSGGTDAITGNGANTTLVDTGSTGRSYTITGPKAGSVGGTTFSGVGTINASNSGNDTFTLDGGVGSFVGTLNGRGGSNTLAVTDGVNAFAISAANAGTLNSDTTFSNIQTLSAAAGTNTFTLAAGLSAFDGSIEGGTGTDTLRLGNGTNAITVSGANAGTVNTDMSFTGIDAVQGGTGTDTLTGPAAATAYTIDGPNAVTVAGISATSIQTVTGGAGLDTFTFATGVPSFEGTINGAGGADRIELTDGANAITITGNNAGTLNGDTIFNSFSTFVGGSGANTLTGLAAGTSYSITGANAVSVAGIAFSNIDTLNGGAGADTFTLASGVSSFAGTIAGNGGSDTLAATNGSNTFSLESANGGKLNTTTTYTSVETLAGGSGADTFAGAGGSLAGSLSDGGGATTLSGTIQTTGAQTYTGAVTLAATTVLTSSGGNAINLGGTVDGTFALTVNTAGVTTFGGAVGATDPLASLTTNAAGTTTINAASVRTNGAQTYNDAVTAAGALTLTSLNAGGNISASNSANDFGTLSLNTTGATDVAIVDTNSLALDSVSLGSGTNAITVGSAVGSTLSRTGVLSAGSTPTLTVGTAPLDSSVSSFFIGGAATGVEIEAAAGGAHNLAISGAGALPALTLSGDLTVTAGAAITQTGRLDIGGSTSVTAGSRAITLDDVTNVFGGAVSLDNGGANNVVLASGGALQLGTVGVGTGTLTVTATGPITQAGGTAITQGSAAGAASFDAGANAITLGNSGNNFTGAVSLTNSGANDVSLRDSNALRLGTLTLGSGTLSVVSGGALTQAGPVTQAAGAGAASFNATAGAITLTDVGNSFTGPVGLVVGGAAAGITLNNGGALELGTTTLVNGALSVTAAGAITQTGGTAITQGASGGAVSIDAGANAITLANSGNNFTGAVNLTNSGANDVALRDAGALQLGTLSLGSGTLTVTAAGALTQAGAVTQAAGAGAASFTAGSGAITLTDAGNAFTGAVALSNSGTANVALSNGGALELGAVGVGSGTLTIVAGGAITQTGGSAITQASGAGAASFGAGANAITLANSGNDFTGAVGLANSGANNVSLRDANALQLGNVAVGSGTLTLRAGGALTQAGGTAVVQETGAGAVTLNAGTALVTLAGANNDFTGDVTVTGGAISLRDSNALTIAALNNQPNQALSLVAGGALTTPGGAISTGTADLTLASGGVLTTPGDLSGANVSLTGTGGLALGNDITASGTLTLQTTNAAITQSGGAISAGGLATVDAGTGDVTLARAGNNFAALTVTGQAVTLADTNALVLNDVSAASLDVTTGNGALTQGAGSTIAVSGTTTLASGSGAITLANAGNDFGGPAVLTGGAISLRDQNALSITTLNNLADRSLSLVAGTTLSLPAASIDTGTGDLTLSYGTLTTPLGSLHGNNVSLTGNSGLTLSAVAADGTLALSSGHAAITQVAGTTVTAAGATTLNAGSGDITLANAGNDFASVAATGGAISLRDSNALAVTALNSGANRAISLVAGGALTTPTAAIDTGSADLTLISGGTLTTPGDLSGANLLLRGGGGLALNDNITASGTLTLQTSNDAITQGGGAISAAGATSVAAGTGNVTLARAGNDFSSLGVTGRTVTLADANALVLDAVQATSLTITTAHGALTQSAAANVSGTTRIDTGTAAVTLTRAGNQFGNIGVQGGAVALVDAGGLVLGPTQAGSLNVNTSGGDGAITQSAAVVVSGNTTLNAGSGNITLTQAGNDFANLSLTGGALRVVDGNDLNVTVLNAGANRAVSLVAGGALTLPAGAIDTGTADLTLASNGGTLATRGTINANAASLSGSAGIVLGGDVTTTTGQTYATAVTLGADTRLDAGSGRIDLRAGVAGAGHDLSLASVNGATDAIRAGGDLDNLGALTIAGNARLAGDVTGSGNQTYAGTLTLAGDVALNAGAGRIALQGVVDGNAHNLVLTSTNTGAGAIRADAALGDLATLTANGRSALGGNVTTTGNQTYAGTLALLGDVALDAGAGRIALQGAVAGNAHDLALTSSNAGADAIRSGAAMSGLARLDVNGRATLGGSVTSSGAQTYAGTLGLAADTTLDAGAGRIALQGAVDGGGHRLALASSAAATDAISTAAAISGVSSFATTGKLALGGNVASSGAQNYDGAVLLNVSPLLSGSNVAFHGTVDGAQALTIQAPNARFDGAVGGQVALSSLTTGVVDGGGRATPGTTRIGADVTTTGAQTYQNAVLLTGPSTLTVGSGTLSFGGTVNGAHRLATSADSTRFDAAVGNDTPLAALSVSGLATLADDVATSGAQSYAGAVTLAGETTLAGSSASFGAAVDGGHALDLQFSGLTEFAASVGASTPLARLSSTGPVRLLGDSITTTGAIDLDGTLQLGAAETTLRGASLSLGGAVSGARDLQLVTNTLVADDISGSGTLRITPLSANRSIGVAGGAGALQVSQALLTSAAGFERHVIGAANGSGTISAGNLTLTSDTTLQSAGGDLVLGGRVDGAFDLALNSGRKTEIVGPIGATTPLRSLTIDNQAAADGATGERTVITGSGGSARIATSGAQSYAEPVFTDAALRLDGDTITATQPDNHFGGAISSTARRLELRSPDGITLGTITLAEGGSVDSGGVLHLSGRLVLNGGTLNLVSNATPTAVDFADPELRQIQNPAYGVTPVKEASAAIVQDSGATISSAAGSALILRTPQGGSILLDQPGNTLAGGISAVSGPLGDDSTTRFEGKATVVLGFVRIDSNEIHVLGAPPAAGAPDPGQAGLEADVIKLSTDRLTTGPTGQIRARLPFLNDQGSQTSIPALTLVMGAQALALDTGFGEPTPDGYIQVRVGSDLGGYLTVRPKGAGGDNVILLAGPDLEPFYDGAGKLTEVRVFYNGDAPRSPQESGALTAVTAITEEAREELFEEAVRTENVSQRLRSGVIAEVGAGRPATVGRESIRMPQTCTVKAGSLACE